MVVCLFCFVCFVATLSDFGLLLFKLKHLELRKMFIRKKVFRFGDCSTPIKVPRFCRLTGFTKMELTQLLDRRSVLGKLFFQNEEQRVLYKLVLVTYPLDHCRRIYSPSNFRFIQETKKKKLSL